MPQSLLKDIIPGIHFNIPSITELHDNLYDNNEVEISMLRLDEIHPVISGNKLFKLYYFLEEAKDSLNKKIITFGGAYSNHLAATAFACNAIHAECIGIVRGEWSQKLSGTLSFCLEQGMQLEFINRGLYREIQQNKHFGGLQDKYGEHILIPEGGFSVKGKEGASLIHQLFSDKNFTHIVMPVGTATTFAGLVDANNTQQEIIGLSVLKNLQDIAQRFVDLKVDNEKKYFFNDDYHFGGYAKKTNELISFINEFHLKQKIQLDFVYTGKMMFGVNDLVQKKYFTAGSKILCIHTGGLQGNNSLPVGTLI